MLPINAQATDLKSPKYYLNYNINAQGKTTFEFCLKDKTNCEIIGSKSGYTPVELLELQETLNRRFTERSAEAVLAAILVGVGSYFTIGFTCFFIEGSTALSIGIPLMGKLATTGAIASEVALFKLVDRYNLIKHYENKEILSENGILTNLIFKVSDEDLLNSVKILKNILP